MIDLPAGWRLGDRVHSYGAFHWLIHQCGWTSPVPIDLALTQQTARQIIGSHVCHHAPATLVIHGHPCPREHL